jgi:hypothetical protein
VVRLTEETPYWWIDHISTILSVPLAVLGFGLAIWQIVKTRRAADAAKAAALLALNQVRQLNLAGLLPQLTRIDDEIDRAVQDDSAEILRFWLSQWKWQAGVARGLLDSGNRDEEKIMRLIQSSIVAASDVRRELFGVPSGQLVAATTDLRRSVGRVTSELGMLAARQTNRQEGTRSA